MKFWRILQLATAQDACRLVKKIDGLLRPPIETRANRVLLGAGPKAATRTI
jgi:hypothetical protein